MLLSAARRLAVLLALIAIPTALASLGIGALIGSSISRSVSVGFYLVGSFLLIGGFFLGNRGPVRAIGEGVPFFGPRLLRFATSDEHVSAISESALFVVLGLVVVVLGVAIDGRTRLF
jgi:hypothetical protein